MVTSWGLSIPSFPPTPPTGLTEQPHLRPRRDGVSHRPSRVVNGPDTPVSWTPLYDSGGSLCDSQPSHCTLKLRWAMSKNPGGRESAQTLGCLDQTRCRHRRVRPEVLACVPHREGGSDGLPGDPDRGRCTQRSQLDPTHYPLGSDPPNLAPPAGECRDLLPPGSGSTPVPTKKTPGRAEDSHRSLTEDLHHGVRGGQGGKWSVP